MKRMVAIVFFLISLCSCGGQDIDQTKIPYSKLYDRFENERVSTIPKVHTKAVYGYLGNTNQGHHNWYYGTYEDGRFNEIEYDSYSMAFKNNKAMLKNEVMKGNNACRKFVSNFGGLAYITGKIIANNTSSLNVIKNNINIYSKNNLEISDMGYYVQIEVNIMEGDIIYFVSTGDIRFNPMISFNNLIESPLHYNAQNDTNYPFVGDVHPYYENGELRNYYLSTNGKFTADMAVSKDMVIFNDTDCKQSSTNPPFSEGFATRVVKIGDTYYSFYGAMDRFEATKSNDGITFENAVGLNENLEVEYQARIDDRYLFARDPYTFYDPDIGKWRIISLNYTSLPVNNAPWDAELSLYTSFNKDIKFFSNKAHTLKKFFQTKNDPEVPQMMKIGNRWYLFASLGGRSVHGVGPISYWIGDINTPIDKVDWESKVENILTGEDLCASQVIEIEGRYYLYGWIPQNYNNNAWGGTINLPQEVYPDNNGFLKIRLDPYLKQKLSKGLLFSLDDKLKINSGEYLIDKKGLKVTKLESNLFNIQIDSKYLNRNLIVFNSKGIPDDGIIGVQLKQNSDIVEIRYSGYNQTLTVHKKGVAITYSQLKIDKSPKDIFINIIVEDNILEVFVNDSYALCARLDIKLDSYYVGAFTNKVGILLEELNVYKLASKENFQDN